MKNLFKPELIKTATALLTFLLVIKLLWFVIQVAFLPAESIDQPVAQETKGLYYRVKLTPNNATVSTTTTKPVIKKIVGSIKDIKLLAIYNDSDISVVTVEHKAKTKVLATGDEINGFTLEGAGSNFAVFSKDNKNYKITLDKKATGSSYQSSITPATPKPATTPQKVIGEVTNEGAAKIIDRSLLEHYANNMDDIYKNIGISEIKEGKDLKGFKINFVRKDSPFAKLGVRRGDVIKSINGKEINSYNAAFSVYKNIKDIDNLSLVIIRGKEEMELEYEIN